MILKTDETKPQESGNRKPNNQAQGTAEQGLERHMPDHIFHRQGQGGKYNPHQSAGPGSPSELREARHLHCNEITPNTTHNKQQDFQNELGPYQFYHLLPLINCALPEAKRDSWKRRHASSVLAPNHSRQAVTGLLNPRFRFSPATPSLRRPRPPCKTGCGKKTIYTNPHRGRNDAGA